MHFMEALTSFLLLRPLWLEEGGGARRASGAICGFSGGIFIGFV